MRDGYPTNSPLATRPPTLDWSLGFRHPMPAQGYAYWRDCTGERAMPSRRDLKLPEMKAIARHAGFIEPPAGAERPDYFIRLAGTSWEEVFGPMTGRSLPEILPPDIQKRWHIVLDAVVEAQKPVRAVSRVLFQGKTWLVAEMLVAPLGEDALDMLFMVFVAQNELREGRIAV